MTGPANMYAGAVASEERWQARRLEASKAFMQFMEMFPNASARDYRTYVEDITGGNSFLRGALPSNEIMSRMAEDRQKAFAQQQLNNRLATMSNQARLAGQIDTLASNFALDQDDDDKVLQSVAGSLGYDPNNAATSSILDMVRTQYPSGFGGTRERLRREIFEKNLPAIQDIIKSNPNLTDDQVVQLIPGLGNGARGGGKKIIGEMLKMARSEAERAAEKQRREAIANAVKDARTQIDATGDYSLPELPEGSAAEVERQIEPYLSGYKKKEEEARRAAGRKAMADTAQVFSGTKGFAQLVAGDAAKQAEFKEHLRRSAQAAGYEPNEADVNFIIQSVTTAGNFTNKEEDEAALRDYRTQLKEALSQDGMKVSTLPIPPQISDGQTRTLAADEYRRAASLVEERTDRKLEENSRKSVNDVTSSILGDEALMSQIARNDISSDQIDNMVVAKLRAAGESQPTFEQVQSVRQSLAMKIGTIQSSKVAAEAQALQEAAKTATEPVNKVGLQSMTEIILRNTQDQDGNPTPATDILNNLIQVQIFSPGSGNVATAEAVRLLMPFLSSDFVEETGGDINVMLDTIRRSDAGKLLTGAMKMPRQSMMEQGMPYGDRKGSKNVIIQQVPDRAAGIVKSSATAARDALNELSAYVDVDDPTTTTDSAPHIDKFNSTIARVTQEAQAAVQQAIQLARTSQSKSSIWSTDGEITNDDLRALEEKLAGELRQTLAMIEEVRTKGSSLVVSLGNRDIDNVMGSSERIRDQRRTPLKERFLNSPGYQFFEGILSDDRSLDDIERELQDRPWGGEKP